MILVLGGGGMLGHKMFQTLSASLPDVKCSFRAGRPDLPLFAEEDCFEGVDISDLSSTEKLIFSHKPSLVINCIGVIKQRSESAAAIPSISINSLLPHLLADWQSAHGGKLVHFSTDCVFSGSKGGYTEQDTPDATDLYGRSKFMGETSAGNALTLRSSVIGRELSHFSSLLEWFLSNRGGSVKGYTKVIYSGVTTNWMSHAVCSLIQSGTTAHGLYQLSSTPINKFELLTRVKDAMRLEIEIEPCDDIVNDKSLVSERIWRETDLIRPDWQVMIDELAGDPTPYEKWKT